MSILVDWNQTSVLPRRGEDNPGGMCVLFVVVSCVRPGTSHLRPPWAPRTPTPWSTLPRDPKTPEECIGPVPRSLRRWVLKVVRTWFSRSSCRTRVRPVPLFLVEGFLPLRVGRSRSDVVSLLGWGTVPTGRPSPGGSVGTNDVVHHRRVSVDPPPVPSLETQGWFHPYRRPTSTQVAWGL